MIIDVFRSGTDAIRGRQLVATVQIENGAAKVDTFDPAFKDELEKLFLTPQQTFAYSEQSADGAIADAVKTVEPGDPDILKIIPAELSYLGLYSSVRGE